MTSEKRKNGGCYCCMPGCRTSSTNKGKVFSIPTLQGKRREVVTKEWARKFHQVLFRYRYDAKFKKRVLAGKAHICSKHFKPSDIIQTSCMSHLKLGSLPTENLPTKSHQPKDPKKRREIIKPALPDNKCQPPHAVILSVSDIISNWKPNQLCRWRMHQISGTMVHLTHYRCDALHASPSISLLVTEKHGELHFSISFDGAYAPNLSASLAFGAKSLKDMLQCLVGVRVCSGYDFIPDGDAEKWPCREVGITFKTRFFNKNCEVTCSGDTPTCNVCSAAHIKCMFNYENESKRKEDEEGVPLANTAPLKKCKKDKLQSTITVQIYKEHRCRNAGESLPEKCSKCGVNYLQESQELHNRDPTVSYRHTCRIKEELIFESGCKSKFCETTSVDVGKNLDPVNIVEVKQEVADESYFEENFGGKVDLWK